MNGAMTPLLMRVNAKKTAVYMHIFIIYDTGSYDFAILF